MPEYDLRNTCYSKTLIEVDLYFPGFWVGWAGRWMSYQELKGNSNLYGRYAILLIKTCDLDILEVHVYLL